MTISVDAFIERWGRQVTLRKEDSPVFNEYGEYDEAQSTWTDTNIKVWLSPAEGDTAEYRMEGIALEPEDKNIRFKSGENVVEGDFILYEGKRYRVIRLRRSSYAGFAVCEGLIRLEPIP